MIWTLKGSAHPETEKTHVYILYYWQIIANLKIYQKHNIPVWGLNMSPMSFLNNLFKSAELFLTCLRSRDGVRECGCPRCGTL